MNILPTGIKDLFIIEPKIFQDARGYFYESYNQQALENAGLSYHFIQDNQSQSCYGTIRGLHFQKGEHAQAKLVSVLQGAVLDVAVDLRPNSPTFRQYFGIELTAENKRQLLIPRGFAHGFSVLSSLAVFTYKCDNYYNKQSEGGILYNDPDLAIDWRIDAADVILSDKDQIHPTLAQYLV